MATTNVQPIKTTAEDEVRALLDEWVAGSRTGDLGRIMACYAPDVLAFDAIMELQFKGRDAYQKHWEMCLSHMEGGMTYEVHELRIATGGDIAFCHYLARAGATDKEGVEHLGWFRVTVCCAKRKGGWVIVHEHFSSPFDPETNKVLDLKP